MAPKRQRVNSPSNLGRTALLSDPGNIHEFAAFAEKDERRDDQKLAGCVSG